MVMLMNDGYMNEVDVKSCVQMFLTKHENNSSDTYSTYKNTLDNMSKNIFGKKLFDLKVEDIQRMTWDTLERYKEYLSKDNKNTTINNRMATIKEFIKFIVPRTKIEYDISQLELIDSLKDDTEYTDMIPKKVLLDYAEWFEMKERYQGEEKKWACLLLFETGIRAECALSINKTDFHKEGDNYILKTKDKGDKDVTCMVGGEIYEALMSLNPESNKVFTLTYNTLYKAFQRANENFESKYNYTPHSIRKLAITEYYKLTGCIVSTQKFANHASISTTQRYIDITVNLQVGAYTRLISTQNDKYKNVDLSELIRTIDSMPLEFREMLNSRLQYNN